MAIRVGRREFIVTFGDAAAWPFAACAQQPVIPIIGFLSGRSLSESTELLTAFRQGLGEVGYVEGRNADEVIE
jgi:putative ABC transport system substrate-binding protein